MKMTVVGGLYVEKCIQPLWDAVFGSGGRAAAAVSALVPDTTLATYVPDALTGDAHALAGMFGFKLEPQPSQHLVSFDYLHPLAIPRITPSISHIAVHQPIQVDAELVLRFGMMEGDAIVRANTAIFDSQSATSPKSFSANGSKANRLAIVLNRNEAARITGNQDPVKAAEWLIQQEGAEVVVVKMGTLGAYVATKDRAQAIPLYRSERVWKLGSGDVYSAAFAAFWGAHGVNPFEAADLASRATAMYCGTRMLPIIGNSDLKKTTFDRIQSGKGTVYLAGPFFDLAQRWLIEEAKATLEDLGAKVFSPIHEVGPGPGYIVAPKDLRGIENSDVVFAILNGLDTGTIFEIGYAVRNGTHVVAFAQNIKYEDMKMIEGTNCEVIDDFTSAIYHVLWKLPN